MIFYPSSSESSPRLFPKHFVRRENPCKDDGGNRRVYALPPSATPKAVPFRFHARGAGMRTAVISRRESPRRVRHRITFTVDTASESCRMVKWQRGEPDRGTALTLGTGSPTATARSHDLGVGGTHCTLTPSPRSQIPTIFQTPYTHVRGRHRAGCRRSSGGDARLTPYITSTLNGSWRWGASARERARWPHLAAVPASGFVTNMAPPVALAVGGEAASNNGVTFVVLRLTEDSQSGLLAGCGNVGGP